MRFLGADCPEELDQQEVERLYDLLEHPLEINRASLPSLVESGLFSRYQAASIIDYRQSSGDILSLTEFLSLDGIGEDFALRVSPFISLEGRLGKSAGSVRRFRGDVRARASLKPSSDGRIPWSLGVRYSSKAGERLSAGLAFSKTYSGTPMLQDLSGHLGWNCVRAPIRLIAGDFNARFGQGLALWSGIGMGGVSSVGSMERRPSGLSPSSSMSSGYSLTGLAASFSPGRFVISSGLALPGIRQLATKPEEFGLMPLADVSWFCGIGQVSVTAYAGIGPPGRLTGFARPLVGSAKTSVSQRFCLRGTEIFSELSYDWIAEVAAGLAGVAFSPLDGVRMASMLRYYPADYASDYSCAPRSLTKCSNEHSVSVAAEFALGKYVEINGEDGFNRSRKRHVGSFAADLCYFPEPKAKDDPMSRQLRLVAVWDMVVNGFWSFSMRFCEKLRTWGMPSRTEIRAECLFRTDCWSLKARADAVLCDGCGLLGYVEGGWRGRSLTAYMRTGVFFVDDWDDRIYVYERDAPGTLNVPACYGRGLWAALTASWKYASWGRIFIRAGCTSYPFMAGQNKKPGNAELKLQLDFRF
ncbi:MAG: hypothetical protein ACI3ZL_07235 [Candidatus Cryptobacteroides sp.]